MSRNTPRQLGFSLVEQLVALAITTTVVGGTVPTFQELRDKQRLNNIAGQLESELQWGRHQAVARNQTVRISFGKAGDGCYVLFTGADGSCDCTSGGGVAMCTGSAENLRTVHMDPEAGVALSSTAKGIGFEANWGTVTPTTTLELRNRRNQSLRLVINITGRIRSCAPGAAMLGHPVC